MLWNLFGQPFLPEALTGNFAIRLLVACVLGAGIGFERDIHGRAAGLRTNMLVSTGAALFMIISLSVGHLYLDLRADTAIRVDPSRIASTIVTGIGFIGAGAIIKEGFNIRGLTTAACLWVSAGVGMAAGAGFFQVALLVTLIGLFTLVVVNRFEKVYSKDSYRILELTAPIDSNISDLIDTVKRRRLRILFADFAKDYSTNSLTIRFTIRVFHKGVTDKLFHEISGDLERSGFTLQKLKWGQS